MNRLGFISPVGPQAALDRKGPDLTKTESGLSFQEVLRQKLPPEGIKFSSHCSKRLEQNNIQVSPQQVEKLKTAVDKAEGKGAKESCIVMDDLAFIVSINNRTVITVVDRQRMKDSVFTNIDSTVII